MRHHSWLRPTGCAVSLWRICSASRNSWRRDAEPRDGTGEGFGADGHVHITIVDREAEHHPAVQPLGERGNQAAVDRVQLQRFSAMNALASEVTEPLGRSL